MDCVFLEARLSALNCPNIHGCMPKVDHRIKHYHELRDCLAKCEDQGWLV